MSIKQNTLEIESLKRDTERFVSLIQICPNGIAVCSGERIVAANPALTRLLGVSDPERLKGRELATILSESSRATTLRKLKEMLLGRVGHATTCISQLNREDASVIDVDVSIDQLELSGGCDRVVVFRPHAVFRNVHEMNREDFIQQAGMHRMAVFGELAASWVHELGQPITAAKGASEILHEQLMAGQLLRDGEKPASIVMASVANAADKFQKIWNFVRTRQPAIVEVSINSVVENAVDLVSAVARHAGATLKFSPGLVSFFKVDVGLMELVLASLIRRSVTSLASASVSEKLIHVTTVQPLASQVEIVIEHNGEALTALEDGQTSVPVEETSGHLALSICRTIVDQNGGIFSIEPADENHGIRYRIIVPV